MRIWIDFDNSPHVHFFAPIIQKLRGEGHEVLITARRFGQVEELAQAHGLSPVVIGRHRTPRFFLMRAFATIVRAFRLAAWGFGRRPEIAVNHGSRSHVMAARMLNIPVMTIYDYEYVSSGLFSRMATKILLPQAIPGDSLARQGVEMTKVIRYPGFKENVYLSDIQISDAAIRELNLDTRRLIVTVRPPATWAHYHNAQSEILFRALVERLRTEHDAQVIVLPRTREQGQELREIYRIDSSPFRVPQHAVDALGLMAHSDAVFSGGGTMIREAAIMGCPAYSIFAGEPGAIDEALEKSGKLIILKTAEQVSGLQFEKRPRGSQLNSADRCTGEVILQHILALGHT